MAKAVPKVKFALNLDEMFEGKMPDDPILRQEIGQTVLDKILERTAKGIDKTGKRFKGYSTEYKDSLKFKAFGKSSLVNLKLTGDMLGTLGFRSTRNRINYSWDDKKENAKAFNHTTGDTVPKRDFLGLPQKELDAIANKFMDRVGESVIEKKRPSALQTLMLKFLKQTGKV